jgi:phage shock protein A
MGLFTRVTTLLKADAHGMVDAVEDRALLLKQHLREAETELERKRARKEALDSEQREFREEAERAQKEMARLEDDISLAMKGGKEDLARFAIKKLLTFRHRAEQVSRQIQRIVEEREELVKALETQERELEELRLRVKGYLAKVRSQRETAPLFVEPVIEDQDVELELLRRKQSTDTKGGR